MLRDITLGQYYPSGSIVHRLDPRTKLAATMLFLISLFVTRSAAGYALAIAVLFIVIKLTKVPFGYMVRGMKAIVMLLMLSVAFNLFLTPGRELLHIGFIRVTYEGIETAAMMAVRLIMLVLGSTILTLTTTPNQLTDGLEKSLGFLKKLGVPVHEISMMMSIALRFIPILVDETDKIMKAQTSRGADFETGGMVQKAKSMIPLLVPLFISAFRRASDLALAMEARCYHGGDGRTKMKPLKYNDIDKIAYVLILLYFAAMIMTRFLPV